MEEIIHKSSSRIIWERGPTRKATIGGFPGEIYFRIQG
jgi:hypothetical protein